MQNPSAVRIVVVLLAAGAVLGGCGAADPNAVAHAADEQAIRTLVDQTVAAAMKRDLITYSKFYAPNATVVLPGVPISQISLPLTRPFPSGYAIKMVTSKVGFSASGDMGYAFGTYEQTAPDKAGMLTNTVGKWMDVFQKQPDGSWGAIADTYNVDPPP